MSKCFNDILLLIMYYAFKPLFVRMDIRTVLSLFALISLALLTIAHDLYYVVHFINSVNILTSRY